MLTPNAIKVVGDHPAAKFHLGRRPPRRGRGGSLTGYWLTGHRGFSWLAWPASARPSPSGRPPSDVKNPRVAVGRVAWGGGGLRGRGPGRTGFTARLPLADDRPTE